MHDAGRAEVGRTPHELRVRRVIDAIISVDVDSAVSVDPADCGVHPALVPLAVVLDALAENPKGNPDVEASVRERVKALTARFPIYEGVTA